MQIKDNPSLNWQEKMKGDPNKRNWNKYCRFHRDHGHDTDECFDLKQQIENLIRQGKSRNFLRRDYKNEKLKAKVEESSRPPLGEIRMIVGDRSVVQVKKDVPEGSTERPSFKTISQDEDSKRAGHHFHGRGCLKDTSSS